MTHIDSPVRLGILEWLGAPTLRMCVSHNCKCPLHRHTLRQQALMQNGHTAGHTSRALARLSNLHSTVARLSHARGRVNMGCNHGLTRTQLGYCCKRPYRSLDGSSARFTFEGTRSTTMCMPSSSALNQMECTTHVWSKHLAPPFATAASAPLLSL